MHKLRSVDLSNHELVVVAAYLVGADRTAVDTEDIAIKASALAPGRFSWRKYKDQVNIETVRKRLWDATKPKHGAYLVGSERAGWRLTKAGFDFAQRHSAADSSAHAKNRMSRSEQAVQTKQLSRLLSDDAFRQIRDGNTSSLTKADAERFFRLDDYVTGRERQAKIERIRIIASSNPDLVRVVDILAAILRDEPND